MDHKVDVIDLNLHVLKSDVAILKSDVAVLKSNMSDVKKILHKHDGKIEDYEDRMTALENNS